MKVALVLSRHPFLSIPLPEYIHTVCSSKQQFVLPPQCRALCTAIWNLCTGGSPQATVDNLSFQELSCIKGISQRMQPVRVKLQLHLSSCLQSALESRNQSASILLLHAYGVIGDTSGGELAARKMLVQPIIAKAIRQHMGSEQRRGV